MKTAEQPLRFPVMEHFYTIQGEGAFSGVAAYFIRLGGCDVGCVWCDVKESWDASAHPSFGMEEIAGWPLASGADLVVITGGEPLMYDLGPLTDLLRSKGLRVNIETSGAYPLTGQYDWICVSPKKFKFPLDDVLMCADELKIIVFNKSDFAWAESYLSRLKAGCRLFLQPEWDQREKMLPHIIDYVKNNPSWRISLQTHKYLGIP